MVFKYNGSSPCHFCHLLDMSTTTKITKALHHWPFVKGIHWLSADSHQKGPVIQIAFPCASYQIRKIAGCACAGNAPVAGKTFPAFPAHAQPAIVRICQEAHDVTSLHVPTPLATRSSSIQLCVPNFQSFMYRRMISKQPFTPMLINWFIKPSPDNSTE